MDYDTIGSDDLLGRLTGRGKGYYYKGMRNVRIFCTCIYILYIIYICCKTTMYNIYCNFCRDLSVAQSLIHHNCSIHMSFYFKNIGNSI